MNGKNETINVFIVADSAVARAGLRSVLQAADEDFVVTGDAAEISAAPFEFSAAQRVDVWLVNVERQGEFNALLDFLGDGGGFEEDLPPAVAAILAADFQSSEQIIQLLQSGSRAVLPHAASIAEITAAVAAAANNLVSLTPEILEAVLTFPAEIKTPDFAAKNEKEIFSGELLEALTPRETEIWKCWRTARATKQSLTGSTSPSTRSNFTSLRFSPSSARARAPKRSRSPCVAA